MDKTGLQKQIKELNKEIAWLSTTELREYKATEEARPGRPSNLQTWGPLFLFLLGLFGFTFAFFTWGEGTSAYLFLIGLATPGALWFMVSQTKKPRWSRWRAKAEAVKRLNELTLEKSRLVRELRLLEQAEEKQANKERT